jgi:sugar phosphate isomerase/epimerase
MFKGFSSGLLGFGDRALKEDIPLAAKYGYAGIEFNIAREARNDPLEIRDLLEKNGLRPAGFGLPVDYRSSVETFEDDMEKLPAYCAFAQKVGNKRCITWIIPWSDTLDYKTNFDLHKARLTRVARILEEYDIHFGLEFVGPSSERKNKKYEFIHNLDMLMELLQAIGTSNLGILMDVWHWDMAGQTAGDFKKIPDGKWITLVHINDAPLGIPVDEQKDLVRELPGATGVLNITGFMRGLLDLNYDGPVFVEPFYAPFKTMPFEDALKASKAAMDKVWPAELK